MLRHLPHAEGFVQAESSRGGFINPAGQDTGHKGGAAPPPVEETPLSRALRAGDPNTLHLQGFAYAGGPACPIRAGCLAYDRVTNLPPEVPRCAQLFGCRVAAQVKTISHKIGV